MAEGSLTKVLAKSLRPSLVPTITILAVAIAIIALYVRGAGFYTLDVHARVEHEDYRVLSPGALVGHGYGIFGTALILTNLLYLVRRRVARFRLGSMEAWLHMHVITGLVGSALILFHSAFQLRAPIAMVTAGSLALVVVTGVVGRYFYAIAPKPDPRRMAELILGLDELVPRLGQQIREGLRGVKATELPANAPLATAIRTIPTWMRESRAKKRAVFDAYQEVTRPRAMTKPELKLTRRLMKQTAGLAAAEVRTIAGSALLRTWRGLHRFLAILMIVSVSVHIGVAWFYGYRWIWSE
jgi:hypothetical protein